MKTVLAKPHGRQFAPVTPKTEPGLIDKSPGDPPAGSPRTGSRFAKQLHELMVAKGVSASDVARAIWGTVTDNRGFLVARNRDRISNYLAGKSLPTPENLRKLAVFFAVRPEELAPEVLVSRAAEADPEVQMTVVSGGMALLKINRLVSAAVAAKVIALVLTDPSEDHERAVFENVKVSLKTEEP